LKPQVCCIIQFDTLLYDIPWLSNSVKRWNFYLNETHNRAQWYSTSYCICDTLMYVCVRVCVYMHACMYVCMYICMYACMYVCMYMCVCMYVCVYVCTHVCMCVCMYVRMYVYMLNLLMRYLLRSINNYPIHMLQSRKCPIRLSYTPKIYSYMKNCKKMIFTVAVFRFFMLLYCLSIHSRPLNSSRHSWRN